MIVPIGEQHNDQILKKITKLKGELIIDDLIKVRFVPLLEGKKRTSEKFIFFNIYFSWL